MSTCQTRFVVLVEDRQFAFEQPGIAVKMVGERLGAKGRRGMRSQTRSCEHVSLGNGYGDRVNQVEDSRMGPDIHDLSLSCGQGDHRNL